MNKLVRPCLVSSGYGGSIFYPIYFIKQKLVLILYFIDTFDGVPCEKQEDCDFLSTSCDLLKGICRAKSTQEIREEYFECFFNNMSAMVEVSSFIFDFIPLSFLYFFLRSVALYPNRSPQPIGRKPSKRFKLF